jgi:hypothetical protein
MKQTEKKNFEKKMKTIYWVQTIILLLGTGLMISNRFIHFEKIIPERFVNFSLGWVMAVIWVDIIISIKYFRTKEQEGLEKAFVAQNDERNKLIRDKTGGKAINTVILGLLLAGIISSLFNETVFLTLLGATVFAALIKIIFKIYYIKHI